MRRLSEEVQADGQGGGHLRSYGTNRLRWIWSAVSAVDDKVRRLLRAATCDCGLTVAVRSQEPQTAQYFGRVLDLCSTCLQQRQTQLKNIGAYEDAKGIAEVCVVA